jgi:hypothetical protein
MMCQTGADRQAGVKPSFSAFSIASSVVPPLRLGAEGGDRRVIGFQLFGQRMIGRDADEGRAQQRVGPGGIDLDPVMPMSSAPSDSKANCRPRDLPIQLACISLTFAGQLSRHPARPAIPRNIGDLEEPLRQFAPFHLRAGTPALAVDHLFIGQHGHVDRVPVDHRVLAVDQTRPPDISRNSACCWP